MGSRRNRGRSPSIPRPVRRFVEIPSSRLSPVGPHAVARSRTSAGINHRRAPPSPPQPTNPRKSRVRPVGPHAARPPPPPIRRLSRRWRPRTIPWSSDDDKHIASDDHKRYDDGDEERRYDDELVERKGSWEPIKTAFPAIALGEKRLKTPTRDLTVLNSAIPSREEFENGSEGTGQNVATILISAEPRFGAVESSWKTLNRDGWDDLERGIDLEDALVESDSEPTSFDDEMMEFFYKE